MDDNTVAVQSMPLERSSSSMNESTSEYKPTIFKDTSDMPLEIWERENGIDYLHSLYNMDDDLPEKETDQMKAVADYIIENIETKGYEPTTESYRAVLKQIEKELGIDRNVAREVRLDRLAEYISAKKTLNEVKGIDDKDMRALLRDLRGLPADKMRSELMKRLAKYMD